MPERFEQVYGEMPPAYWPDAPEMPEPSRLFEPYRIPGIVPDLASAEAARSELSDESVEIDMTIGVGEDPGWQRARAARQWKEADRTNVRQDT